MISRYCSLLVSYSAFRFNNDPSIDVLLMTTHVGGLGLNLTGADTVVFVEHDWNPMKDLQVNDCSTDYLSVCVYSSVCVYTHLYIFVYSCICVLGFCACVCVCVCVCVCTHTLMHACM